LRAVQTLTKIVVTELFGIFNHSIPINLKSKLTIVTAPNGFGKTVILRLINAFYNGHYHEFFKTDFAKLELHFGTGIVITITKRTVGQDALFADIESRRGRQITIDMKTSEKTDTWNVKISPPESLMQIERNIPFLDRAGSRVWVDLRDNTRLTLSEVLEKYGDLLPGLSSDEPDWLVSFRNSVKCHYIETQRLLRVRPTTGPRRLREYEEYIQPVVNELATELAGAIKSRLAEYATLSQSLDSTFPHRLIARTGKIKLTEADLRRKLGELDARRSKLMEAGLLDKDEALKLTDETISATILDVLAVYAEDTEQKLRIFDDLYTRLSALRQIINSRFQYKQLTIDRNNGMVLRVDDGRQLDLEKLSSGEQHELVLIYQLLFKVTPGSLILIDEPELSLHVAWQKEFIDNLFTTIALSEYYSLIATHSPQIINDRWDLTVQLQGPTS
jgi:ABC-type transport system involved in cytochrome c biogenesis ATPase subunit